MRKFPNWNNCTLPWKQHVLEIESSTTGFIVEQKDCLKIPFERIIYALIKRQRVCEFYRKRTIFANTVSIFVTNIFNTGSSNQLLHCQVSVKSMKGTKFDFSSVLVFVV